MAYYKFGTTPEDEAHWGGFFSPNMVDQQIRQAIQCCWMSLPKTIRNVDETEKQIRRIVDRAIRDLREDHRRFQGSEPNGTVEPQDGD